MKIASIIFLFIVNYISFSQNVWEDVIDLVGIPFKIECVDSNNIFIVTTQMAPTRLYKSTNQGINWELTFYNPTLNYNSYDMSCPDLNNIYISLDKSMLYKSNNGGISFDFVQLDSIIQIRQINMFNANLGVVCNASILITRNSWESFEKFNIKNVDWSIVYRNPLFKDDSSLFTIIYESRPSAPKNLLKLNINSKAYEICTIDSNYTVINDFYLVNENLLFVCGKSNNISGGSGHDAIYKSTDGGRKWRRVLDLYTNESKFNEHDLPPFGIQSIAFKDSLTGIAVGQFGKIVYTYDGGESWQYENNLPPQLGGGESNPPTMIVRYAGSMPIIAAYNGYIHRLKENNLAPGPEHIYTISGRVWEGEKGQPGIPVSLGFRVTMTDSLGYYKFTKVKAGTYTVKALNKYHENPLSSNYYKPFDYEPLQYEIDLTSDSSGFDFNAIDLRTFYTASGYILNTDNKGLANITFKVADSTTVSDSTGKFHFPRIESRRQYDLTPITEGYSYSPAYHTINLITGDTTELKFTATPTTSVWESGKDRGIVVSPNPARDYITIQFQTSEVLKTSEVYRVQIFDVLGLEVMSESIHPMTVSHRMNVEKLPAGVYFVSIKLNGVLLKTDKFIIVR